MQKTRSAIMELLAKIKKTKKRYVSIEKDILSLLSDKTEYDRIIAHFDDLIAELEKELKNQPIGYRYTGVYYLKKSYPQPVEFIKNSGSLYMRENLVSWQVEKEPGVCEFPLYRAVYAEPEGRIITREDAEPVYYNKK